MFFGIKRIVWRFFGPRLGVWISSGHGMELSDLMVPALLTPAHQYVFGRKGKRLAEDDLGTTIGTGTNTPLIPVPRVLTLRW